MCGKEAVMKRKFVLIAVLAFILLFSCATLQELVVPPTVSVRNVDIQDFSFEDITLNFTLDVNNSNPFGVAMSGFDYLLAIEGAEFLQGTQQQAVQVVASSVSQVHIPLTLKFNELWEMANKLKDLDSLRVELTGNVAAGGIFSGIKIPYDFSMRLPNVRIPKIAFKGVDLKKMGFTGADLEVTVNLENPNSFGFDIRKLDYTLALAGTEVASGLTEKLAAVPAKGTGEIKIPISVGIANFAPVVRKLIGGTNIDVAIQGATELNTPFGIVALPINTTQNVNILR